MEVKKFVCQRCGNCCKEFQNEQAKELKVNDFFDDFLFIMNEPQLPFFDWEINDFKEELKKIGSDRKILPQSVFFDLKNNRTIVLFYTFDGGNCPFLQGNDCVIYDKRPIACRRYPFKINLNPIIWKKTKQLNLKTNINCESEVKDREVLKNLLENNRFNPFEFFKERYGEEFYYNVGQSLFESTTAQFIAELQYREIIKLAKKGYDLKFLLKRVKNFELIGISSLYEQLTKENLKNSFNVNMIKEKFNEHKK